MAEGAETMAGRNMPSLSGAEQCAAEAHNACLLFAGSPRKKKGKGKKKKGGGGGGKGGRIMEFPCRASEQREQH